MAATKSKEMKELRKTAKESQSSANKMSKNINNNLKTVQKARKKTKTDKRIDFAKRLERHKEKVRAEIKKMQAEGLTVPQATIDLANEPTPYMIQERTYNRKMQGLNMNTVRSRARIVIPEVYHPTDASRKIVGDIDTEVRVTNLKNNINKILKDADPSTRLANTLQLMVVIREGKPAEPGMDNDFFTIDSEYDPKKDYELSKHIKFKKIQVDEAREILKNPFTNYAANEEYKKITPYVSNIKSSDSLSNMSMKTVMDLEYIMNTSYAWLIVGAGKKDYDSEQGKSKWEKLFKHVEDVYRTDKDGLSRIISMIENGEKFEKVIDEANLIIKNAMEDNDDDSHHITYGNKRVWMTHK